MHCSEFNTFPFDSEVHILSIFWGSFYSKSSSTNYNMMFNFYLVHEIVCFTIWMSILSSGDCYAVFHPQVVVENHVVCSAVCLLNLSANA